MDTTALRYGLARGREWVCLGRNSLRLARDLGLQLIRQEEQVWLPALRLGPAKRAWTTSSLEVALERQAILRRLTTGWATTVRRVP